MKVQYWNAIILALIGGFIGIHEFYLGNIGLGVASVLFCWTGIPAIIALIKANVWLFNGEEWFKKKYAKEDKAAKPLNS